MNSQDLARQVALLALERKALNPIILDIRKMASYTDFLVVTSGTSDRHVQAVAEFVEESMRKAGVRPIGAEGMQTGQWALVDFGEVVLHVFHEFNREVYQLEQLWKDAPRLEIDEPRTHAQQG